jgi:hypothetical protein
VRAGSSRGIDLENGEFEDSQGGFGAGGVEKSC